MLKIPQESKWKEEKENEPRRKVERYGGSGGEEGRKKR